MRHRRNANMEREFARMARELRDLLQPALGDSLVGVSYLPVLPRFSIYLWHGAAKEEKDLANEIGERFAEEHGPDTHASVSSMKPPKHWFIVSRSRAQAGESIEEVAEKVAAIVEKKGDFDATRVRSVVESVKQAAKGHGKALDPVVVERRARDILTSRHGISLAEFEASLGKLGKTDYHAFYDWLGIPAVQFDADVPGFKVCFGDLFTIPEHEVDPDDDEGYTELPDYLGSEVCLKVIPHVYDGKILYATLAETWPRSEVVDGDYATVSFRSLDDLKEAVEEFASGYEDLPIPPNGEAGWPFSPGKPRGRNRSELGAMRPPSGIVCLHLTTEEPIELGVDEDIDEDKYQTFNEAVSKLASSMEKSVEVSGIAVRETDYEAFTVSEYRRIDFEAGFGVSVTSGAGVGYVVMLMDADVVDAVAKRIEERIKSRPFLPPSLGSIKGAVHVERFPKRLSKDEYADWTDSHTGGGSVSERLGG